MKVKCTRILDARGRVANDSDWLTIGREYVVLSITANTNGVIQLRLVTDPGEEGAFDSSMFVVTDPRPSSLWSCGIDDDGNLDISPSSWQRPGFWDELYDIDPSARVPGDRSPRAGDTFSADVDRLLREASDRSIRDERPAQEGHE